MTIRLVFLTGSQAGKSVEVERDEITIGRAPGSTITYQPEEVLVSGKHATVFQDGVKTYIRDDHSRNGTFVNGQRITGVVELGPGQELMFGPNGPTARVEQVGATDAVPPTVALPASAVPGAGPADAKSAAPKQPAAAGSGLTAMYHMAKDGAAARAGGGRVSQTAIMKEFVKLAAERTSRRNRIVIGAVAAVALASVALVFVLGEQRREGLEGNLATLTVQLETERGARATLEGQLASLSGRAEIMSDSLRAETERMQRQVQESQEMLARQQSEMARQRAAVESDRRFGATVTQRFSSGVGIIQVAYGYQDSRGNWLRLQGTSDGRASLNTSGGAIVEMVGHGTGFLIDPDGWVITNRHVAEIGQGETAEIGQQRFTSRPRRMRIFFPPGDKVYDFTVERVYEGGRQAPDLGLLRLGGRPSGVPVLPIVEGTPVVPGDDIVLLGYPGGAEFTTGRVGDPDIREAMSQAANRAQSTWIREANLDAVFQHIQRVADGQVEEVGFENMVVGLAQQIAYVAMLEEQGRQRQIQPHLAMASVSDTTAQRLLYSAVGGSIGGSSGGAIMGRGLAVVAVNFAGQALDDRGMMIQRQLGVPVRYIWDILPGPVAGRARQGGQ